MTRPVQSPFFQAACLLALTLLQGCAAEGTDFEALPFYREDRTIPGVFSADIPLLLTTIDTYPSQNELNSRDPARARPPRKGRPTSRPVAADDGSLPSKAPAGKRVDGGYQKKTPDAPESKDERDYYINLPWPLGAFSKQGSRVGWKFNGLLPFDASAGLVTPGPLGRAISSDAAVRKDLLANLATDPVDGGFALLPFIFSLTEIDHDDFPDRGDRRRFDKDVHLWPLFAYGTGDSDEDDYFAVIPFGGTTRGILGKEKITWYGFPYPLYAEVKDRAYESHHILWPLINWIDGPRNSGFRILPFYGHYERRGLKGNKIFERTYVMWPFVSWSRSGLNEEEPTEVLLVLPFYGSIWGPTIRSRSILWPFFKYEERRSNSGQVSWELRAPFPFLQLGGDGQDYFKFDLWPLFGYKQRAGFQRHFVLWPIWRAEDMETRQKRFTGRWFLPLFWYTHWEIKKNKTSETKFRILPLLHYRRYRNGAMDVGGLNPFWFDSPGFDRTIGALLRLYRYTRDQHGGTEHQALFGLFSYRDLPELAPDQAYKGAPARPEYSRLSLLFGLFQYRNKGGEHGLRFLWIVPEITWGEVKP